MSWIYSMGLFQKAQEISSKLSEQDKKNYTISPEKKKTSLLKKALNLLEIPKQAPLETSVSEVFKEEEETPLLDLDSLDSQAPSVYSDFQEKVSLSEEQTKDLNLETTEQEETQEVFEDVIDLDELEAQLESEVKKEDAAEFLGQKEIIDIGEGSENNLNTEQIQPKETIDLGVSDTTTEGKQKELEDSLLEEISKEEPIDDFQNTLEELEEQVSNTKKELLDLEQQANKTELEALQRKLENYLILLEITKDLVKSGSFDEFFENLLYSIEGEIGPESILIFSRHKKEVKDLYPVANDGIDIESDFYISESSSIYELISILTQPIFAKDLDIQKLEEKEKLIIENPYTEVIIPIRGDGEFLGFVVCGKLITGEEYTEQDFEFLKLISELAGNMILKLYEFMEVREEVAHLNESVKLHESISSFSDALYHCNSFEVLFDELLERLERDFEVLKFSLFLISPEDNSYKIFSSNLFSPETINHFSIPQDSKIITLISQVTGMYKIENFDSYPEFTEKISQSELTQMHEFSIFPLIHLERLFGMLVVHEIVNDTWKPEQKQAIISISNLISPVVANLVLKTEKETFLKNPFNPVQELVERQIELANESSQKFTLVVLKVLSVTRILNLLGPDFFRDYIDFIIYKLQTTVQKEDLISRVGEGKFAIFLKGKDKQQSEEFFTLIKKEFIQFPNPPKEFKLSIQLYSLSYPDQARDKRKFIEIIEDT